MADNVGYTPGTGATVAADDIGGILHQRVKVEFGADGAATDVSSTDPLPVGVGPGSVLTGSGSLGTAVDSVVTIDVAGSGFLKGVIGTSTTGTYEVEGTSDGTTWETAIIHFPGDKVTSPGSGLTPTASESFEALTAGYRQMRLRTSATLGSAVAVGWAASLHQPYVVILPAGGDTDFEVFASVASGPTQPPKPEDFPSSAGDWGIPAMAVRQPSPANTSGTVGDYEMLQMSAGRLWTSATIDAALPAGTANIGDVDVLTLPKSATATLTNVSDTAVSTTLLAANAARLGATIWNDSTEVLYVKFGTTASVTSATVKMVADAYYEVPFGYTGRIDGIWASDASGAARITELT